MDSQYILRRVKELNEISIDLRDLHDIPEFKTGKSESSIENLALTLNGHSPIKNYSFDIKKLESWCEENGLIFCFDAKGRLVHLKT